MNHAHISTEEIREDIAATQAEITRMSREEQGFRLVGDRMSIFKADARRDGITQRRVFIGKLEEILKARGETP